MDGSGGEFVLAVVEDGSESLPKANIKAATQAVGLDGHGSEDEERRPPEDVAEGCIDEDGEDVPPRCSALNGDEAFWVV